MSIAPSSPKAVHREGKTPSQCVVGSRIGKSPLDDDVAWIVVYRTNGVQWGRLAAVSMLFSIPLVFFFFVLQRDFRSGLGGGSFQ
jgi:hypothetical protein